MSRVEHHHNRSAGGGEIRVIGNQSSFCDRLPRRDFLRIGSLAPLGLSLPALLAQQASAGGVGSSFGKAKRCLMIFMWGGPAHQDLWDMKPDAPSDVRGEFKPIATNVPGINICEHLPNFAQQIDKVAFVNAVHHTDNNHSTSAHWMLTGYKHRLSAENFSASPIDHPHIGSVLSKLRPSTMAVPTFVALPDRIATTAGPLVPGQFGGMLGGKYDPFTIDDHPDREDFKVGALSLPAEMSHDRIRSRQHLLSEFNQLQRQLSDSSRVENMDAYSQRAADLVTSPRARDAFDMTREPTAMRDRYGRHTFGQGLLLGRRLLEAGVQLVTVYWHRDMPGVDTTWDTHAKNFSQLKDRLIPAVDKSLATLFDDLQQRGMLDDTLVVWNSEFGRTPRVNGNAGRDHWGSCNTIWMGGAGVRGGTIHGESDKIAAYPQSHAVGPADVSATIFHLLGIAPHSTVTDRENRPFSVSHGEPIAGILS